MSESILDVIGGEESPTMDSFLKSQESPNPQTGLDEKKSDPIVPQVQQAPVAAVPTEEEKNKGVKRVVVIKPIGDQKFRLGLENTPEKYRTMPGTTQRWAPKKVGNLHRTGLDRPELGATPEERKEAIKALEYHFGKPLDRDFYAMMSFKIDSNKPLGERLHLDRPEDLVVYLAMLESDDVANGIHEYKNGTKPFAQWYIEDKEAEAEHDAKERTDKLKAAKLFEELSYTKKRKISNILGLDVVGLRDAATENVLWKYIDAKLDNAREFLKIVARGDSYINVSELVNQAMQFAILRQQSSGDIFYADQFVGATKETVIEKLLSPKYGDLRLGIQTKVDAKLKAV